MSMRADHEASAAVRKIAHGLFFAGRFAVKIDDDRIGTGPERASRQLTLDGSKRIIERIHENAPHGIDHERALAILGVDHCGATARRPFRVIDWTDQARRPLDKYKRLALIPRVVAERDGVCASIDQLIVNDFGNAKSTCRVLTIDNNQIELPCHDEFRQPFDDNCAPGPAHDIADKKNAHTFNLFGYLRSMGSCTKIDYFTLR